MSAYGRKENSPLSIIVFLLLMCCYGVGKKFEIISTYYSTFIILSIIVGLFLGFFLNQTCGDDICAISGETSRFSGGCALVLFGPIFLFLSLMIANYSFDMSEPVRHEATIESARGWTTTSRKKYGGYTTHYHGQVVLASWDLNKYPHSLKLSIPYETVGRYKFGEKAYVTTKHGALGLTYCTNIEPAPVSKPSLVNSKGFEKNNRFSLNTNTKEKPVNAARTRTFADPKDPDFGKIRITKKEFEALSEDAKVLYKKRRKAIRDYDNSRNQEVKPKLMGY